MTKETYQPLGGNEMPRFAGPGTMMRLPAHESAEGLDACFAGVPFDIGTSNRAGARHGPRQIRAESHRRLTVWVVHGLRSAPIPIGSFDRKLSLLVEQERRRRGCAGF